MASLQRQRVTAGNYFIPCFCHNTELSTPQDPTEKAWKAIEDGEISTLELAIQEIKGPEAIEDEDTPILEQAIKELKTAGGGSGVLLDTCRLMEKSGVTYSMSLLALCGFHGREDMVDLLLKEGADMNAECPCMWHTGTPLLQMMLHCLIQDKHDNLSTMVKYFSQKNASLRGKITFINGLFDQMDDGIDGQSYGLLDLSLSMKKIDCAKVLVEEGVDLLSGGCEGGEWFDVVPMFQEYRDHGTNEFIRWAFNEYLPKHPEVDLKRILLSIIIMKEKDKQSCFWQSVQRSPAHAILTSHHEGTIKQLVQCGKENGLDLLAERSCTGKTALHVAAENNDVDSVNILLQLGADTRASDNSDMNPFMLAIEKGHSDVVKMMMEKDLDLVCLSVGSGSTVTHWALEKGHSRTAFFKACFEENPRALLTAEDSQGNTIAHMVASSGNTEVFEILWSKTFAEAVILNRNLEGKTPLHLAVEKGHVNILKTFKTCVDDGKEATAPQWQRNLKTDWWNKIVPYFLHASLWGSLDVVKYFIDSGQKPNVSHNGKTPLLCAAEAGYDEIVAYLLQFREVQTYLKKQSDKVQSASESPLLIASQNGHTKCVTLLLQNGGSVLQRDSEGRNCLMIAIQNHHKVTALAILSGEDGLKALTTAVKKDPTPTPLHQLVKEMPDLAEYVLNKCITQAEPKRQISIDGEEHVDSSGSFVGNNPTVPADQSVHYNFDYLEDSNGQLNHIDKPELHIDGEDSVGGSTVTADHEHQENSGEQISHEHHEKYINELKPKQQIVADGEDDVDVPTVTAEKPEMTTTQQENQTTTTLQENQTSTTQQENQTTTTQQENQTTTTQQANQTTTTQPDRYNFGDRDDKDRQILHNDHSNHILDWMMEYNRLELLQHPLVENYLCQKFWSTALPLLLLNLLFYLTLLVALNWLALVVPRPGPDSETCPESDDFTSNGTSSGCPGQSGSKLWFLAATAYLLYILSILGFLMEVVQLVERKWKYFEDSDNYFQLALYISTIIFIHGFDNECWCSNTWQWQIGALAVFLSWFNFIFILKYMSYTAIPINMFLRVCVKFLKMIFLPIVLILAFGVPHYMVFVRTKREESLPAFKSSSHAIAKTLLQLAGEFDFEDTFNRGDLLYGPTAYILFITFLITMPILFINLLNALAVGETQEITMNAELTTLKLQVELIQEQWGMKGLLTILERLGINRPLPFLKRWQRKQQSIRCKTEYRADDDSSHSSTHSPTNPKHPTRPSKHYFRFVLTLLGSGYHKYVLGRDYAHHAKIAKELKERNEDIYNTMMGQNPVREDIGKLNEDISTFKQEMMNQNPVREDINKLKEEIGTLKQEMMAQSAAVQEDIPKSKESTLKQEMMNPVREDITKLKEEFKQEMMAQRADITKLKEDIAKLVQALTPSGGN